MKHSSGWEKSRRLSIFLSVGTGVLGKKLSGIMDYMQAIFSWVNAPLFATMLLGMFVV